MSRTRVGGGSECSEETRRAGQIIWIGLSWEWEGSTERGRYGRITRVVETETDTGEEGIGRRRLRWSSAWAVWNGHDVTE